MSSGQTALTSRLSLPETRAGAIADVARACADARGSIGAAAVTLGVARRTLYRLLEGDAELCAAVVEAHAELGPPRREVAT